MKTNAIQKEVRLKLFISVFLLIVLLVPITYTAGFTAEIPWKIISYSHYAQREDLKVFLADFFSQQGIGMICSKDIQNNISGQFNTQDPPGFFRNITQAYNLVWYYDGAAVYIYSAHEMISRILNLEYLNMNALKENLEALEIIDNRFGLKFVEKDRIVFVSGPPRYVELVSELAHQLDQKAMNGRGRDDVINVFPLKHAWADDKTLYFHDHELVIPGVATLLRNVITGQTAPGQVAGWKRRAYLMETVSKLKGKGLSRKRPEPSVKGEENYAQQSEDTFPNPDSKDGNHPQQQADITNEKQSIAYRDFNEGVIQADPRQNALLVRDREEKMPYYKRIIALLDVPVGLVEIRATIIDVDQNNLDELGIEWQLKSASTDNESITQGGFNSKEAFSEEGGLIMPLGSGLNIATIIGDSRNFFLARVSALQEKGHAKILSRPSVLTMNNVEAQLEHSKTFYVRVAGAEEVDLFDITAGVTLRVTPHIIEENRVSRVKLAIQIQDGTFSELDEEVDNIPVVQNSIINTQAVVGENESLLIGGYKRDEESSFKRQIPCLGEIPFVGWLFKKRSGTSNNTERLFMITPTIVPYGSVVEPQHNSESLFKKNAGQPQPHKPINNSLSNEMN